MSQQLAELATIIKKLEPQLTFTALEIGARPLPGQQESFHDLLKLFPGSRIIAFELDHELCEALNRTAPDGVEYFPVALGCDNETRLLYKTRHPMCSSLYQPDELLARNYNNLGVLTLKTVSTVVTSKLDAFMELNGINDADFIKIDVQGAELDVFKGAHVALKKLVCIVSEVEFIPMYVDQPLFGDVCSYLKSYGIGFHKFLGLAGRSLMPIILHDNPNAASQHMWADAVFIRDIFKLHELDPDKLLKMGLLALLYGSPDVSYRCFSRYDELHGSGLRQAMLELLQAQAL